ncbi:putative metalloendopeptidase [Caulobacter ginsengisoli]|uniref:Metalloendopeptidase n=1 Tax=Caulobacter ginsengisoli TaxID=400775 RepID=A0ABU0ILK2_9CAUL|nr:M13 family metallopeptidase [Caulobacter ginsengisoli]MDQ0462890.1 putative metalloendopeptidase [Caulobacter ginsengisoli]
MTRRLLTACAAAAILSGSALAGSTPRAADPPAIDASVRPGDDFYGYANGDWLKTTPLPQGRDRYDTTAMLRDETARQVRDLVEAAAKAPASARARRIGDYYASWMDQAGIEAKGVQPLAGGLAAIAVIRDRQGLATYLGRSLRLDDGSNTQTDGLFGVWIHQGFHDPDHYVPHLVQGGLGLPDRDDYLDAGPEAAARRDVYRAHVARVLKLAGFDQPDLRAGRVLALEIAIAKTHASRADTDDVFKTDNAWRRADFAARAPGLDWAAWFKAAGLDRQDQFLVWQPSAVVGAASLVGSQPLVAWKDYLAFHLAEHHAAVLPRAFGGEGNSPLNRPAGGPPLAEDRVPQAIAATTAALGEDIGQLYVARYFPPQAKAAAAAMAETLRTALIARVERQAWRSPAARQTALAKLAGLRIGVGYPDRWIDYSGLAVVRGDAFGNLDRAEAFAYRRELAKLGRPVDPAEWIQLYPQQVGAIINFSPNAMQFSAALLQPPYFDPTGDAATNYGSAGAGMAHEITHSVDELGSLYDARGRLVRWWGPEDLARYRAAAAPLLAQLNAYCPQPGLCVNGEQVLGESIADLAGLLAAHDAYLLSLNGRPDTVKNGLTGEQRFFLAFARRWRRVQTDAALRRQIATDTHPPGAYRTATVRNLEAWGSAFDVKPGDSLYLRPEARPRIW